MTRRLALPSLGLAAFLLAGPFLLQTRYAQHVLILVLLYVTLGSAWNILGGFAGQLSLGHAAFFGIGAYSAAIIASKSSASPWWGMIAGPVVVLPVALAVGWTCFRLRGPYFTLATIAVSTPIATTARILIDSSVTRRANTYGRGKASRTGALKNGPFPAILVARRGRPLICSQEALLDGHQRQRVGPGAGFRTSDVTTTVCG